MGFIPRREARRRQKLGRFAAHYMTFIPGEREATRMMRGEDTGAPRAMLPMRISPCAGGAKLFLARSILPRDRPGRLAAGRRLKQK